ncbi:MAG: leucine-rich repeat domain-containing protein [Oscillospiraceae bacterium]|nr:leucine-rich repeat domain-containing protein [Oscillospiraceae bacterium]
MRKTALLALLLPAVLLCACSKEEAESRDEQKEVNSLVKEWMADDSTTEPVKAASEDIDAGATPLDHFEYTVREDGSAAILKYKGSDTEVVITSHIGEAPVTEIGQYAFEAAWDIETITLPESITVIGEQAFLDCDSMTSINIPEGVTKLQRATFAGCSSLTELTIPASVTETQEEMLAGCQLTDLYVLNPDLTYQSWGLEDLDPKCTIHAPEGAAILQWANDNGFPTAQ